VTFCGSAIPTVIPVPASVYCEKQILVKESQTTLEAA
jgi:hypothetical protein